MKNFIVQLLNFIIVLSILSWLVAGVIISVKNIWDGPSPFIVNMSSFGFFIMLGFGTYRFFTSENKLKSTIKSWFVKTKTKKEKKKGEGCNSCKRK